MDTKYACGWAEAASRDYFDKGRILAGEVMLIPFLMEKLTDRINRGHGHFAKSNGGGGQFNVAVKRPLGRGIVRRGENSCNWKFFLLRF